MTHAEALATLNKAAAKIQAAQADLTCLICGWGPQRPWDITPEVMTEIAVKTHPYAQANRLAVHVMCLASDDNQALGNALAVAVGLKAKEE